MDTFLSAHPRPLLSPAFHFGSPSPETPSQESGGLPVLSPPPSFATSKGLQILQVRGPLHLKIPASGCPPSLGQREPPKAGGGVPAAPLAGLRPSP